ncbi:MAG: hypothetical protein JWN28_509 [Candidatus Saccharibacteria bacterium]|nr:hypothetical protein [Candidatus Saccharibacteria bacterium]
MDANSREIEQLYDLFRHTLRPSQELQAALEPFRKPRPVRPRFLVKSLFAIALDPSDVHNFDYNLKIKEAIETFEEHRQPLQVGRDFSIRRLADGALKILLTTENHDELNDLMEATQQSLSRSIGVRSEKPKYDLFVRIEPSQTIGQNEIRKQGEQFFNQLHNGSRKLFHVTPETIVRREELHYMPISFLPPKEKEPEIID